MSQEEALKQKESRVDHKIKRELAKLLPKDRLKIAALVLALKSKPRSS